MAHFLLSAEASFAAAHTLPGVDMCARMHGHNWRVRVTVRVDAADLDTTGMGVDFRALEGMAQEAVSEFEHQYLNELPVFADRPPTAERIAQVVCERMVGRLAAAAPAAAVVDVSLWEMPQYKVTYYPE